MTEKSFHETLRDLVASKKYAEALQLLRSPVSLPSLQEIAEKEARIERLEADREDLKKRLSDHIDYSIDLQRIIEDLCSGRPIRKPATSARHHYEMAVAHAALNDQEPSNA